MTPQGSFTQAQRVDDASVGRLVVPLQVLQHAAPAADQLEQAAARTEVLAVGLQVAGQLDNALSQKCHLDLRRTRVFLVDLKLLDGRA